METSSPDNAAAPGLARRLSAIFYDTLLLLALLMLGSFLYVSRSRAACCRRRWDARFYQIFSVCD